MENKIKEKNYVWYLKQKKYVSQNFKINRFYFYKRKWNKWGRTIKNSNFSKFSEREEYVSKESEKWVNNINLLHARFQSLVHQIVDDYFSSQYASVKDVYTAGGCIIEFSTILLSSILITFLFHLYYYVSSFYTFLFTN